MKKLSSLLLLVLIATACSKTTEMPETIAPEELQQESASAVVPTASITVVKAGNSRTITLKGKISRFYFDRLYKKSDGTLPGDIESTRTFWRLEYDKIILNSYGKQEFEFKRTAAYTYEVIHTISPQYNEYNRITLVISSTSGTQEVEREY